MIVFTYVDLKTEINIPSPHYLCGLVHYTVLFHADLLIPSSDRNAIECNVYNVRMEILKGVWVPIPHEVWADYELTMIDTAKDVFENGYK